LIIIIIYYSKNLYKQIQNKINEILFSLSNIEIFNTTFQEEKIYEKSEDINLKKLEQNFLILKNKKSNNFVKIKSNKKKEKKISKKMNNKNITEKTTNLKHLSIETIRFNKKDIKFKNKSDSKNIYLMLKRIKKTMAYNDTELNDLEYSLAKRYDKRKYCQYYFSLLKTRHAFIFTFFNNNDYNSKIIKIDLFIFNFALFYVINAIFFNDDTMHKIYTNKGSFDLRDQLPQIVYSSILSSIFSFILEMLALTEGEILKIKKIRTKVKYNKIINKVDNRIKIKQLLYFIISNIFLVLFWYYLSMFCAIYINTQIHLIKDTIFSYILSFIEPFIVYLIPGVFRILALYSKHNYNFLYKFSIILQNILF